MNEKLNQTTNTLSVSKTDKWDTKCFMDIAYKLFDKNNQIHFLDNIKHIINLKVFDPEDNIFEDITYHKDVWSFIDNIIYHISEWKYSFLNSYSEDSEYTPTDPDFRLIDNKKYDVDRVNMFMDHLRNWEFDKADDLNVDSIIYIDHKYDDVSIKDVLFELILETKSKAPDLHKKLTDLFYTSEERINKVVTEEIKSRFDEEEIKNIWYESYVEFYWDILSKIPNNILYNASWWGDLDFRVPVILNWVEIDAKFTPEIEFKTINEVIRNVKEILKTAKIIEGKGILLNPNKEWLEKIEIEIIWKK